MDIAKMNISDMLQVDPTSETLFLLDQRVLINDSVSEGLLRRELIQIFGKYGAKNVLTRYGYAHGWRTAEMLSKRMPSLLNSPVGGASLHKLYGLFITTKLSESYGSGDEPLIKSIIHHSYEAEQHLLHFGLSEESICWTLTGFASGYESFKHNKDVYFIETKCIAKGDEHCEIEGRFADKWGDRIKSELPFYGMESTNDILKELSEQIKHTEKKLKKSLFSLKNVELKKKALDGMVVRSKPMTDLINLAERTGKVDTSVLITGESGVGKELLARYIHTCSKQNTKPFIAVNCGAFSDTLLESELFGHVKGAFTGADREHKGLIEEANGGTLFLDEIGETTPSMQVKLLRFIQEKEIRRIGENTPRKVNVRIISATNKCLEDEITKGNFRRDLFYRLKVIELKIPPLKSRSEDILPMAYSFLKQASQEMGTKVTGLSPDACQCMLSYDWPGNVRELKNVVQRACALCDSGTIECIDLPQEIQESMCSGRDHDRIRTLEELEKDHIERTLKMTKGDKKQTADILGIGIATLYRKLKSYGMDDSQSGGGCSEYITR
ncbi:MAG: sigma 54-interacting transcriptional regulator [Deferribacterales bacterium]